MWSNIQFEKKNTCNKMHTQFSAHIVLVAIGYMLSTQEEVMFRYFEFDNSMIIGLLEELFISGGTLLFGFFCKKCLYICMFVSCLPHPCK